MGSDLAERDDTGRGGSGGAPLVVFAPVSAPGQTGGKLPRRLPPACPTVASQTRPSMTTPGYLAGLSAD